MTQTFNEDVDINGKLAVDGEADETQVTVRAHSTQTQPLQSWQDNAGEGLVEVAADGRLQVGDDPESGTPEALLEVNRAAGSAGKPKRGLHVAGEVADDDSDDLKLSVHELTVSGSNTTTQKATALSARTTVDNADVDEVVGLEVAVESLNGGTMGEAVGLQINDVTDGVTNYALKTGAGQVQLGDLTAGLVESDADGNPNDPGEPPSPQGPKNPIPWIDRILRFIQHGGTAYRVWQALESGRCHSSQSTPTPTSAPSPNATPNPSTPIPTQQPSTAASTPMPQVNLDTSALTGLVAHNPKNPSETNTIRIDIQTLVGGNSMVATATALGEFNYGLTNLAGPTEQANAQALLVIVTPIADNPSARILAVPTTRAFGIDDRIIFGTGDNLAIATVTGNTRAVTYVRQFVPSFSALQHAPARFRENFV